MIFMISVAIQAGGRSSRMGRDKALVPLGGKPLIAHVAEIVAELGDDLFVTTNNPEVFSFLDCRMVPDPVPGLGALAGLRTALSAAQRDRILVVACDMPFLQPALLNDLITRSERSQVVVPCWQGAFQPLVAVYQRSCLEAVRHALSMGEMSVVSFFDDVQIDRLEQEEISIFDPDGRSFININTPDDLAQAERLLAGKAADDPSG